jgi:uncharacterized membrane-anchored protein
LLAKDRGAAAGAPQTVNYNTYALGRDGYFEMNLLTNSSTIDKDKASARDVLAAHAAHHLGLYGDLWFSFCVWLCDDDPHP